MTNIEKSDGASRSGILLIAGDDIEDKQQQQNKNNVTFNEIHIYEFPVILGDNPGASSTCGPPLSIGWNCYTSRTISLDMYECTRKPKKLNLIASETKRIQRLKGAGFTDHQIERAIDNANIIRKSRRENSTPSTFWSLLFFIGSGNKSNSSSFGSSWTGKATKRMKNMETTARTA